MDKGIFAQARPLLEEALEGQRTTLGEDHPDTLASLGNLGLLRYNEGKLDAAEPLLRRSVGTLGLPLFFFLFSFFFCNRTSLHSFLVDFVQFCLSGCPLNRFLKNLTNRLE